MDEKEKNDKRECEHIWHFDYRGLTAGPNSYTRDVFHCTKCLKRYYEEPSSKK